MQVDWGNDDSSADVSQMFNKIKQTLMSCGDRLKLCHPTAAMEEY